MGKRSKGTKREASLPIVAAHHKRAEELLETQQRLRIAQSREGGSPRGIDIVEQDPVEAFALGMVRDYLSAHKYDASLKAFNEETRRRDANKPSPSVRMWYEISEHLGVAHLVQVNREAAKRGPSAKSYASLVELLIRQMIRDKETITKLDRKVNGAKKSLRQRARAAEKKKQEEFEKVIQAAEKQRDIIEKNKAKKKKGSEEEEEHVHKKRGPDRTAQRTVEELFKEKERGMRDRRRVNDERDAKVKKALKTHEKMLSIAAAKQAATDQASGSGNVSDRSHLTGDGDSTGNVVEDDGADGTDDNERPVYKLSREHWIPDYLRDRMWKSDITQAKAHAKQLAFETLHKDNDRDLKKYFQLMNANDDLDLLAVGEDFKQLDLDEVARCKEREGILKQTLHCALCEKAFPAINLSTKVTSKAIADIRTTWQRSGIGIPLPESPGKKRKKGKDRRGVDHDIGAKARGAWTPTVYDPVRICLFCEQFFSIRYRQTPRKEEKKEEEEDEDDEDDEAENGGREEKMRA